RVGRRVAPPGKDEAPPASVVALEDERAPGTQEPGEHEAEPEEARQRRGQALAVGAQRELEDEEEQEREERERVQCLLGPPLHEQVLPDDRPCASREDHEPSSVCNRY